MSAARTWLMPALGALTALLLAACPGPPVPAGDDLAAPAPDTRAEADGAVEEADMSSMIMTCGAGACGDREICAGAPGCRSDWACVAAPGCTKDLVAYCGCDGKTFRGSGNCPGQPYLRRGACDGACVAQDAAGVGACDAIVGVFFDGAACRTQSGCRCEGRDCKSAYPSLRVCEEAHRGCSGGGGRADGAACSSGAECQSGICEGMGCGKDEARCVPKVRGCTRDLVPFCGCDGVTFPASSTCPGRPYKSKGPC